MDNIELKKKLTHCFNIKTPCIWINTLEEERAEKIILEAYAQSKVSPRVVGYTWSCGEGGKRINLITGERVTETAVNDSNMFENNDAESEDSNIPTEFGISIKEVLKLATDIEQNALFIIRDIPDFDRDKNSQRSFRDLAERKVHVESVYVPIVIISTIRSIPTMVSKLFQSFDLDLLKCKDIVHLVHSFNSINKLPKISSDDEFQIAKAATGLTINEISSVFKLSAETYGFIDRQAVMDQKVQSIKKSSILTYIEPKKTLDTIGGHKALKEWIKTVKKSMSKEAEEFGIKPTKGLVAMGLAGTGKSAMAEAIANYFGVPLIIFDLSRIMGGFVGESETTTRHAFETINAIDGAVILMDEADKQFSGGGAGSAGADAGTMSRVFGVVLQNLQENKNQFYILTANDISKLPSPLMRPGRVDSKWFFDFPDLADRKNIFRVYFSKAKKNVSDALLDFAAKTSDHYTGAEIEVSVNNILKLAFFDSENSEAVRIKKEHVLVGIRQVSTIYKTNSGEVSQLKEYASKNNIKSTTDLIDASDSKSILKENSDAKDDFAYLDKYINQK